MSTFVLIRHGSTPEVGKILSGTRKGIHLSEEGLQQASTLIHNIHNWPIESVYTSPLERASETAGPLAQNLNVPLVTAEPLTELAFGDWTGKSFAELDSLPEWMAFNARRSSSRPPGGESLEDAQSRVMPFLKLLTEQSMRAVVLVTHADIIKTIVMTALEAPLDCLHRFDIDPASITIIDFDGTSAQLRALNLSPLLSMASRLHPSLAG